MATAAQHEERAKWSPTQGFQHKPRCSLAEQPSPGSHRHGPRGTSESCSGRRDDLCSILVFENLGGIRVVVRDVVNDCQQVGDGRRFPFKIWQGASRQSMPERLASPWHGALWALDRLALPVPSPGTRRHRHPDQRSIRQAKPPSAATRVRRIRTASESVRPTPASAVRSLCFQLIVNTDMKHGCLGRHG